MNSVFLFLTFVSVICIATLAGFRFARTRNWQPVEAIIKSSEVKPASGPFGKMESETDHGIGYKVEITYEYNVNGVNFVSRDVFGTGDLVYNRKFRALQMQAKFPKARCVTAYYDPDKPRNAVLIRARPIPIGLVVCLFLFLFLLITIISFISLINSGKIDVGRLIEKMKN